MKSSSPPSSRPAALVVGDDTLVTEFASLVAAHGYDVIPEGKMTNLKPLAGKISIVLELSNRDSERKKRNLVLCDKALPATTAILSSSVNQSVLSQAQWITMKHRLLGIAALPTFIENPVVEVAPSAYTLGSTLEVARTFFSSLKKEIAIVQDRVGMVLPRILCQIINEALFAVQQGVASPKEIDLAMKLGTNYPMGPIEWGEKIGFDQVYSVLAALHDDLKEERYRICPLLHQLATTGKFW